MHEIGTKNLLDYARQWWSDSDTERWLPKAERTDFYARRKDGPPVGEIINRVCRDIPVGYEMELHMEKGSGYVDLSGPGGVKIEYPSNMETIAEQLEDALEHAIKHKDGIDD